MFGALSESRSATICTIHIKFWCKSCDVVISMSVGMMYLSSGLFGTVISIWS